MQKAWPGRLPKEPWPIFPACPVGACQHCCAEQYRQTFERLLELFWIVVLKEAPAAKAEAQSKEPLLLSLKSASTETERVLVAFHTRRAPLQAAVLLLHKLPEPGAQDAVASFSLSSLAEPIRPASLVSSSLLCKPQVPSSKVPGANTSGPLRTLEPVSNVVPLVPLVVVVAVCILVEASAIALAASAS